MSSFEAMKWMTSRSQQSNAFPPEVELGWGGGWAEGDQVTERGGWRGPTGSGANRARRRAGLELRPAVLHGRPFVPAGYELAQRLEGAVGLREGLAYAHRSKSSITQMSPPWGRKR